MAEPPRRPGRIEPAYANTVYADARVGMKGPTGYEGTSIGLLGSPSLRMHSSSDAPRYWWGAPQGRFGGKRRAPGYSGTPRLN